MKFENMVLYSKPTCPYCMKVLYFMEANDIDIDVADATDPQNRQRLVEMNGTTQVPCLVVDGKPMLESSDIIAYLERAIA